MADGDPGDLPPRAAAPGAQLSFTDHNGYRFQVFITNQPGRRIERLQQLHRAHAVVEDRIRCGKEHRLRNLPFQQFQPNAAWLEPARGEDVGIWTNPVQGTFKEQARPAHRRAGAAARDGS